nr:sensitive to high expression protein 9 like, mitochondrial [Quercus suber]
MQALSRCGAGAAARETIAVLRAPQLRKAPRWICLNCRSKIQFPSIQPISPWHRSSTSSRELSTTSYLAQNNGQQSDIALPRAASQSVSGSPELPSTAARSRSDFSNRFASIADNILARASIAGQHINVYTGTDYSGIQSLREDIVAQESDVKSAYNEVEVAKEAHHKEYAKQAGAQKEIVGLLERKASWSPTDLERYMSLVRSEHVNDQAVQNAKRTLEATERRLEDARQLLERLERKQYHEEQVWSDTIRRNSTWVTFGLMGVNILLLLGQILLFEPMRRRKIVRDLREALDEKTVHALPHESRSLIAFAPPIETTEQVKQQVVDTIVDPAGVHTEDFETNVEHLQRDQIVQEVGSQKADPPAQIAQKLNPVGPAPSSSHRLESRWYQYRQAVLDLFSDRAIHMKQVDLTSIALQGAGVGAIGAAAIMSVCYAVFRA